MNKPPMSLTHTVDDPRWQKIVSRDLQADGSFVYATKTTGIYCRPSCPSRLAKAEHIIFYDSGTDAEQAGFRACKRCRPTQLSLAEQQTAKVTQLCRYIERCEQAPTLIQLADYIGISPYHLHRLFKRITGVTPKGYFLAQRNKRVRQSLKSNNTVTEAIYDSGYNSNGHFYAETAQVIGMTPQAFRAGGMDTQIYFAIGECSLGAILVARSAIGVCAILLGDDPQVIIEELQDLFPKAHLVGCDTVFEELIAKVVGFVESPKLGLDLPLDIRGTAFQQRVWQALREIPAGQTASYSDIAQKIGSPKAVRAVAGACAANKLAVAVPCHRVVHRDGSLSGYRWGVERKRLLLNKESTLHEA